MPTEEVTDMAPQPTDGVVPEPVPKVPTLIIAVAGVVWEAMMGAAAPDLTEPRDEPFTAPMVMTGLGSGVTTDAVAGPPIVPPAGPAS